LGIASAAASQERKRKNGSVVKICGTTTLEGSRPPCREKVRVISFYVEKLQEKHLVGLFKTKKKRVQNKNVHDRLLPTAKKGNRSI
jgi:hypothetical protein